MAMQYSAQHYFPYGQPQWPEDVKPALTEDNSSVLDDKVLDTSTPADVVVDSAVSRRPSVTKFEDDFPPAVNMWHDRPQGVMPPARHYSQSSIPMSTQSSYFGQTNTPNCAPGFAPAQPWCMSARSEASTPTPFFGAVQESFGQQMQYTGGPVSFTGFSQHEPVSAVSMSPQSSQGGWASTTSSDGAEGARSTLRHARFRAASPLLVLRSDGIRKKNAKFEIPKERNLHTIDALIMQSTNEEEKKELKQQKRLLRNRQAALDSRLRKKQNAEKLEADKKLLSSQKNDLEETIAHLEAALAQEREQWHHQRQQYEQYIQQLTYERDEAIRTKTLETSELRRKNNLLTETVRELDRQQARNNFSGASSDTYVNDFDNFRALDLDDSWDEQFRIMDNEDNEDLKMEESECLQREATPRPTTASTQTTSATDSLRPAEAKKEVGFSWGTFTMCAGIGAHVLSQISSKAASSAPTAAAVAVNLPSISDDYRTEAGNVLQAVLASGPDGTRDVLPSRSAISMDGTSFPHALSHLSQAAQQTSDDALANIHSTLTTPSRQQQVAAAFSLSTEAYNHITGADDDVFDNDPEESDMKPTKLQQLFASMQAERDGLEKMNGLGSKARERSILLDRVPEKVLRDLKEMIAGRID